MSSRGHPLRHRGYSDVQEGPFVRALPNHHPAVLEEEFEMQQVEFHRLMVDNRALFEDRATLQRELAAGKTEIHRLNIVMAEVRAEKDSYIRELYEKGMKLEADVRVGESLRNETLQRRADVEKLVGVRQELVVKVQNLSQELARARSENQQVSMLKSEIDGLKKELIRVRNSFELEKKGNIELFEQRQQMERNIVSMTHEIEKLRAELGNAEGRPWNIGGSYGMKMGISEGVPPPYGEYNIQAGVSDKVPLYGPGSGSWGAGAGAGPGPASAAFDNRLPRH